jgi:hypothetical protein
MDLPEEKTDQIAKRRAIKAIMNDSTLNPQEKQKMIQGLMINGVSEEASVTLTEISETMVSNSNGNAYLEDEAATSLAGTPQRKLLQDVMESTELTPQERQRKIPGILTTDIPKLPPANQAPASVDTHPVARGSSSSLSKERTSSRVSTVSRSQDLGAIKGRRAHSDRTSRGSSESVAGSIQTSSTRDRWARKSEMSQMASDSARSNDTSLANDQSAVMPTAASAMSDPEPVVGRDSTAVSHNNFTTASPHTNSSPSQGRHFLSPQRVDEAASVEPPHHQDPSSRVSPYQPTPEYAGLNYDGEVAMGGISVSFC